VADHRPGPTERTDGRTTDDRHRAEHSSVGTMPAPGPHPRSHGHRRVDDRSTRQSAPPIQHESSRLAFKGKGHGRHRSCGRKAGIDLCRALSGVARRRHGQDGRTEQFSRLLVMPKRWRTFPPPSYGTVASTHCRGGMLGDEPGLSFSQGPGDLLGSECEITPRLFDGSGAPPSALSYRCKDPRSSLGI